MTRPGWENTCEHGLDLASCSKCQGAAAIAAAEERGRRSGVEERDELRAALRKYGRHLPICRAPATVSTGNCYCGFDAALAPRASAPVYDAVLSSDPFREWRCGKPKDHEGPHSGEAPRDSGKEPE